MANNNTISSFTEDIIETLKTIQSLEILQAIEAGMRLERIKRTMVSTQKGYLSIGGKSLLDIVFVPTHSARFKLTEVEESAPKQTLTHYSNTSQKNVPD